MISWPYKERSVIKMSLQDNKSTVLRQLGQESEPISLFDLLNKLGGEFKEPSVRRWLSELIQEGVVKKTGQKRGTKYFIGDRQVDDRQVEEVSNKTSV